MTTESRDAVEDVAAAWIASRDGEGWTPAQAAALEAWLAESAGHRVAYYRLKAAWDRAAHVEAVRTAPRYRGFAIAASVLLLLLAGAFIAFEGGGFGGGSQQSVPSSPVVQAADPPAPAVAPAPAPAVAPADRTPEPVPRAPFRQRFDTAVGASRVVSLPDGSRVTLDTDSLIRVSMDDRSRDVQLDHGQAFFEVAHDARRPFVVSADRLRVTAVGTAFSVRRVASEARVVVAEGTVRIDGGGLLPAGGIARVESDTVREHTASAAELAREMSWRDGVLTFRHTSLSDAVSEFNRYGARHVVIRDPSIATLEVGGVFASNDVEAFVHLVERTFPVDVVLHPDRIELTARRSP